MNEQKFHVGIKALVRNDQGKLLLLRVNSNELKENKHGIYWDLPGGRIKEGDTVEDTLRKELEEEIGYSGDIGNPKLLHGTISKIKISLGNEWVGLVLFIYVCDITPENIQLSFEHTEYKWSSIEEAKELLSVKYSEDFIERLDEL